MKKDRVLQPDLKGLSLFSVNRFHKYYVCFE
jgi:hypothetical protein